MSRQDKPRKITSFGVEYYNNKNRWSYGKNKKIVLSVDVFSLPIGL